MELLMIVSLFLFFSNLKEIIMRSFRNLIHITNLIELGFVVHILYIGTFVISMLLKLTSIINVPFVNYPLRYGAASTPIMLMLICFHILFLHPLISSNPKALKLVGLLDTFAVMTFRIGLKEEFDLSTPWFSIIPSQGIITDLIFGYFIIMIFLEMYGKLITSRDND